jgi:hypothetical protein
MDFTYTGVLAEMMNTSFFPGFRSGVFALSLLGMAVAPVQAQKNFKRSLPKSTLLLFSAPDVPTAIERFKKTEIYKIWQEEEVQDFLADALEMAKKRFDQQLGQFKEMYKQGMLPIDPEKLLTLRLHGVSFALVDLAPPSQQSMPKISIALCLDFGPSAGVIKGILGMGEGMYAAQAKQKTGLGPIQEAKVGTIAFKTIVPPKAPFLSLNWGWVGSSLLIGTHRGDFESIASKMLGGEQGGLMETAAYKTVSQKIHSTDSALEGYFNFSRILDLSLKGLQMAASMEPDLAAVDFEGVKRVLDVTGISGLQAVGYSSGYDGGMGITRIFGLIPNKKRKGFFANSDGQASVSMDRLKVIPPDVAGFSIARFDFLKNFYKTALAGVQAYDPKVGDMVKAQIKEMEKQFGFNFEQDVFNAFGPEIISYSMPLAGLGGAPELGVMLSCPKPKKTVEVLRKIGKITGGYFDLVENETEDGVFYAIDIQMDTGGGMDPLAMIEPTLAFEKGFMIFGLSRSDVRGAIKRLSGENKTSILDNKVFQAAKGSLPDSVDSVSFSDNAANFSGIYSALSGVISFIPIPPEVPIDLGLLPSETAFTNHLLGSLAYSQQDPRGFASVFRGPLSGPETAALIGVGVVGGIFALIGARKGRMGARRFGK